LRIFPDSALKLLDKAQFLVKDDCVNNHLSNLLCEMTEIFVEHSVLSLVNIAYNKDIKKK
jgi:hypothetical protein